MDAPTCVLCGGEVEPWPGGNNPDTGKPYGYGHNPEPLARYEQRCCDVCNTTKVIPARLDAYIARNAPTNN